MVSLIPALTPALVPTFRKVSQWLPANREVERGWVLRFDRSGNTFGFTLFGNGREKEFTSGFLNRTAPNRPIIGHAVRLHPDQENGGLLH